MITPNHALRLANTLPLLRNLSPKEEPYIKNPYFTFKKLYFGYTVTWTFYLCMIFFSNLQ